MAAGWSALGEGIAGLANNLMGQAFASVNSKRAWKYTQRAMQLQYDLNQKAQRNQYQNTRYSLEQAGYNPLLAVGASASGMTPSATMGSGDTGFDNINSALALRQMQNETKLRKSQVDLNKSQEDLNTQATYKTFADELVSRATANNVDANSAKVYQDIENSRRLTEAQVRNLDSSSKFNNERARGFSASSSESRGYSGGALSVRGSYSSHSARSQNW